MRLKNALGDLCGDKVQFSSYGYKDTSVKKIQLKGYDFYTDRHRATFPEADLYFVYKTVSTLELIT